MISKYVVEKWERKRGGMVCALWREAEWKNEASEEQADVGVLATQGQGAIWSGYYQGHVWVPGPVAAGVFAEVCGPGDHEGPHQRP